MNVFIWVQEIPPPIRMADSVREHSPARGKAVGGGLPVRNPGIAESNQTTLGNEQGKDGDHCRGVAGKPGFLLLQRDFSWRSVKARDAIPVTDFQHVPFNNINGSIGSFPVPFVPTKGTQKLSAVIASGHGFPARVHNINAPCGSGCCDFSRALMKTMLILHQSRPKGKSLIIVRGKERRANFLSPPQWCYPQLDKISGFE